MAEPAFAMIDGRVVPAIRQHAQVVRGEAEFRLLFVPDAVEARPELRMHPRQ